MDSKLIHSILTDSAALVQKTAQLQEEADKVPALAKQAGDLAVEVGRLNKEASDLKGRVRTQIEKVGRRFVDRGVLPEEKLATFVIMIENDPAQVVEVMEKIANEATAVQIGAGGDKEASGETQADPIEAFAMR